ncbi:MAG: hypothetical protein EU549_02555 [Promethearchaeota archaeon]|nr:MAG: hypothetical protein EU549_02555 [Candidatus Lokiarchaeota archaeon]
MNDEKKAIIGFDTTQNERGKLEENYTKFKSILIEEGHKIHNDFEFPLSFGQLSRCDIVIFACPDRSRFREFEIQEIIKYVVNGGNVIFLTNAGGDKGLGSNLNEVGREFGITSNNDQVCDDEHNYGIRTLPICQNFELHQLTTDIELLLLPGACSLNVSDDAIPIISSDGDAEPPNAPVIAVSEKKLGRFLFFGSYEMFRDNIRGGIQVIQHKNLLKNTINWLLEDINKRRMILDVQAVFNAISFKLKKKKRKEKSKEPKEIISSAPVIKTPDGKISPESMLDQIISSLRQIKDISGNLNIINTNLTKYAQEIQSLRSEIRPIPEDIAPLKEKLTNISGLFSELKDEIESIKISKTLDKAIDSFKDFKLNFESQIDIIMNKNLNPLKLEFSEINEKLNAQERKYNNLKEEIDLLKEKILTNEDLNKFKEDIINQIKKNMKGIQKSDE